MSDEYGHASAGFERSHYNTLSVLKGGKAFPKNPIPLHVVVVIYH